MRVDEAKRLFNDPTLKEGFELLRKDISKEFENSDPSNPEGLVLIRLKFEIIRDFYTSLQKVLNEAAMEK